MLDSILPIPFSHPAAKNRFVLNPRTNGLTLMPSGPLSILRPHASSHLLHGLLLSILREPLKPKQIGVEDESIDSLVRRRLGPGVAENMVSAMVHGIYAADSRMLSARSTFPVLWDAEQTRGSIVLGMLRGAKLDAEAQEKKAKEKAEWDEIRSDIRGLKDKWSLYGLKGGIGALEKELERNLRRAGVEFRLGEGVEKLEKTSQNTAKVGLDWGNELMLRFTLQSLLRSLWRTHMLSRQSRRAYWHLSWKLKMGLYCPVPPKLPICYATTPAPQSESSTWSSLYRRPLFIPRVSDTLCHEPILR